MAVTPLDLAIASRVLSPIIKDLYESAKGSIKDALDNWKNATASKRLARKIAITDKVKTIWAPDKEISLSSFYYPNKINISGTAVEINSLASLPPRNLIIEGIVGQGKSILLRYLCIQELSPNGTGRIPVFIELRTLSAKNGLLNAIYNSLTKLDIHITDEVFDYLAKAGKLVILLDAFDEVDIQIKKEVFQDIENLIEKYEELQFVITSRPKDDIQNSRHVEVIRIAPLSTRDFDPFLRKLGLKTTRINDVLTAIQESPSNVSSLINTPLMLTLVIIVYESENEIPQNLPEFFEKLFHIVFTRHDSIKGSFERHHHSGLSERKLQELFEAFCCIVMHGGYRRSLTNDQFERAFSQAQEYATDCKCDSAKFKLDITKVACLMLEEGIGLTTFLHKSILEYHAAAFIKHSSDDLAKQFYESMIDDSEGWTEVLRFLQKIDPYRFVSFYLKPSYDRLLYKLGGNSKSLTAASIEPTLKDVLGSITADFMGLDPYSSDAFDLLGFSHNDFNVGLIGITKIIDAAIHHATKHVPGAVSKSFFTENAIPIQLIEEGRAFNVVLFTLIRKIEFGQFVESVREVVYSLEIEIEGFKEIIDKESKKKELFPKRSV